MTWIRIDDHRVNVEEIVRYSPSLLSETRPDFHTEIEFSTGDSIYVKPTPEEVDEIIRQSTRQWATTKTFWENK